MPKRLAQLLRIPQWPKNLLLLAPLIFSGRLTAPRHLLAALIALGLFCALSSAVYILNDIWDAEEDRRHPEKRHRPVAAGEVPLARAAVLAALLATGALTAGLWWAPAFGWVAVAYFALTTGYTLFLKRIPVLDAATLVGGFLLRTVAGAAAVGVAPSAWLLLCTALLTLFIVLAKRRAEAVQLGAGAAQIRATLRLYAPERVDRLLPVAAAAVVASYLLYALLGAKTPAQALTLPFVLYGVRRYLGLSLKSTAASRPERLLVQDRPLLLSTAGWALFATWIQYF